MSFEVIPQDRTHPAEVALSLCSKCNDIVDETKELCSYCEREERDNEWAIKAAYVADNLPTELEQSPDQLASFQKLVEVLAVGGIRDENHKIDLFNEIESAVMKLVEKAEL